MPALLRKPSLRNPLAYPAGAAPGFDPGHPVSGSVLFSGIAVPGGGFFNLLTGQPATQNIISGKPSATIDGALGPSAVFVNANAASNYFPAWYPTAALAACTMAAIYRPASISASNQILIGTSAAAGVALRCTATTGTLAVIAGAGSQVITGLSFTAGQSCFVAVSWTNTAKIAAVLVNLATGQLQSAEITNGAGSNGTNDANLAIGNRAATGGSASCNGNLAAAMLTQARVPLSTLLRWAQDPWAFWYPRNIDLTQIMSPSVAAGGSFLAAWAQNSNLPILGTGTY